MEEIFKEIPEAKGYSISNLGNVMKNRDGYKLKVKTKGNGNSFATPYVNGSVRNIRIDETVAKLFLDPPEDPSYLVLHIDGDRKNCRADNLKWVSKVEMYQRNPDYRRGRLIYQGEVWDKWRFAQTHKISGVCLQIHLDKGETPEEIAEFANNKFEKLTVNGVTKTYTEWVEATGFDYNTIRCRIKRGWSPEEAIMVPSYVNRKAYMASLKKGQMN